MIQINGQIQRAVANRDAIAKLMKNGKILLLCVIGSDHVFLNNVMYVNLLLTSFLNSFLVEEMMEYLEFEENNQLLGGEAKANAVIAAEPVIRQMFALVKSINLQDISESMNSEAIRSKIVSILFLWPIML